MTPWARRAIEAVALPIVLAASWWWVAETVDSIYVATPPEIWVRLQSWWPTGWSRDLLPSVRNIVVGFALALAVGTAAGLALGQSMWLRALVEPTVDFVRAIPKPVLVPCLLLVFGFSANTRILIVFLSAVWPILIGATYGVLAIDPRLHDVSRTFGLGPITRLRSVTLPAASPHIMAGAKSALAISVVVVVVSEMYGSTEGLGHFIIASQRQFDISGVWLGTLLFGLVGFVLNTLFGYVERRLLSWHHSQLAA